MTEKLEIKIEPSWKDALSPILSEPYMHNLRDTVRNWYEDPTKTIYPEPKNLFNAFDSCPFEKVSIVILGQDPYHGADQAHGLCFSVPEGTASPPSLQNIFKEIKDDVGADPPPHGDLSRWAGQGVFLLNAILTVEARKPTSHHGIGWEEFTDHVIQLLSEKRENLVFMLWGNYAKQKQELINQEKHLILTSPHPSPYSASSGFFGCKHFSRANDYLKQNGKDLIQW